MKKIVILLVLLVSLVLTSCSSVDLYIGENGENDDTVTPGIIPSGFLDVELEYWDGNAWNVVDNTSHIFTNELWEPGMVEVVYLKVANSGSLALKYRLSVDGFSEVDGINTAGEPFKLSDCINVGVVENVNGETDEYASLEDAIAAVADAKKISADYTKRDSMFAGEEMYLALVVWMPDDIANHNGTDIPKIKLGISLVATQIASEEDSFDKYYDGGAQLLVW